MNDKQPVAEAVSVSKGLIVAVGSNTHVFSKKGWNVNRVKLINLKGKTMLPGFYDAHSHVAIHSVTKSTKLNLASPPIGNITTIDQIKNKIKEHIE